MSGRFVGVFNAYAISSRRLCGDRLSADVCLIRDVSPFDMLSLLTYRRAQIDREYFMRAADVPGEDQSGSADSDRTKRRNHPSSRITTGAGIAPATASAPESRCSLDVVSHAAVAILR